MATASEDDAPERPEDDVEMTFFEHIGELRKRLIYSLLGITPGIVVAWIFKEELLEILVAPWIKAYKHLGLGEPMLHYANPIDPFVAYMKLAAVVGLIAASPWIFFQLWLFIAPGLYHREKRLVIPFVLVSTLFFVGGSTFGYLVVFPLGFETFLSFAGNLPNGSLRVQPTIMINEYLGLSLQWLVAFGVVFEVPVILTFLSFAGVVTWRQLLKFGRWWVVLSSVIAAILTPPDVLSQMLMLGPLIGLYYLSVLIAWLVGRKRDRADKAAAAAEPVEPEAVD